MRLFLILPFFVLCQLLSAQGQLETLQWQEDLQYLQSLIHEQYPQLFYRVTAEEFDAAVNALHKEIPHMQRHEIIIGIARIVAQFRIGNTILSFNFRKRPEDITCMWSHRRYGVSHDHPGKRRENRLS